MIYHTAMIEYFADILVAKTTLTVKFSGIATHMDKAVFCKEFGGFKCHMPTLGLIIKEPIYSSL